jgi:hypothetical protein
LAKNSFGLVFIFYIIVFSSARSCLVFLFASFTIVHFLNFNIRKDLAKTILFGLFACAVAYVYIHHTATTLNIRTLYNQQTESMDKFHGANRVAFLGYTIKGLIDENHLAFGHGIASYASRTAKNVKGYMFKKYEADFPFDNELISGGSTYNVWLGEYGIVGTLLFISLYFSLLNKIKSNKIIFTSFLCGFLGLLAQKLFESYAFGFFYWFIFGIYLIHIQQNKPITGGHYEHQKMLAELF